MSRYRTRLERIMSAAAGRIGDTQTVATMTDDALARIITGRPDAKAADLTDKALEDIIEAED